MFIRQMYLFAFIGLLASASYAAIFNLLLSFSELNIMLCSMAAYTLSTPISYFGNKWQTFSSKNPVRSELLRYLIAQLGVAAAISTIVGLAYLYLELTPAWCTLIAVCCAPVLSYLLYSRWVYKTRASLSAANK